VARILAIDYGVKRTGLAVTDPLQLFGQGLTALDTKDILPFLEDYIKNEAVEKILIGLPFHNDGTATDSTKPILKFVGFLKRKFPGIAIETVDEAYTSKQAIQTLIASGIKQKDRRNKKLIDEVSATIILQQYLGNVS
jgi:putative holliday junction resolvase